MLANVQAIDVKFSQDVNAKKSLKLRQMTCLLIFNQIRKLDFSTAKYSNSNFNNNNHLKTEILSLKTTVNNSTISNGKKVCCDMLNRNNVQM